MSDPTPKRFAVIHCGQLVTLAGKRGPRQGAAEMRELAIIGDGAMLIADGKIEWKGTTDELRGRWRERNICR